MSVSFFVLLKFIYYLILCFFPLYMFFVFCMLYYNKSNLSSSLNIIFFLFFSIFMMVYLYILTKNSMYSMLVLIVFVSGLMVVFSYFVNLENSVWGRNLMSYLYLYPFLFGIMYLFYNNFSYVLMIDYFDVSWSNHYDSFYFIFLDSNFSSYFTLMLFLFFILILAFSMCYSNKPLRKY